MNLNDIFTKFRNIFRENDLNYFHVELTKRGSDFPFHLPKFPEIEIEKDILDLIEKDQQKNELDWDFEIDGFIVSSNLSKEKNYESYKEKARKEPFFLSFSEEDTFGDLISFGATGCLIPVISLIFFVVLWIIGVPEDGRWLGFSILSAILLMGWIVIFFKGLSRVGRYKRKLRKFKKNLDKKYDNETWMRLRKYFWNASDWVGGELVRYNKLVNSFNTYQENENRTKVSIFIDEEQKALTQRTIKLYEKNISFSKKMVRVLSHIMLFFDKQKGQYVGEKNLIYVEESRKKFKSMEQIQLLMETLKEEKKNNSLHTLADREILFDMEHMELIETKLLELDLRGIED